jgi:predicted GNAT family N-acyltransferase
MVDDPDELAVLFLPDKHLHIYALADLAEPFWSASTWWRNGDASFGLVGLSGNNRIVYAVSSADPAGTLGLAAELATDLPAAIVTGVTGIGQVFEEAGRELVWHRGYHRFHLTDPLRIPSRSKEAIDLDSSNVDELLALYVTEPNAAYFLPEMLDSDTFVGVRRDGELIAAAGTHVLDERYDVAAIGAVYTKPEHRGSGLGHMVTAGVLDRIRGRIGTIGLNCTEANAPARTIYRQLGFTKSLAYDECEIMA